MDLGLCGRTALVTGASQGIGRGIARRLALEGVRIVGAARRTDLIDELAREVAAEGGAEISSLACDLSLADAPIGLADAAVEVLGGRVDILANVAGASQPVGLDAPAAFWAAAMQLGFLAPRQLTHALLPVMRDHGWGRILNVTGTSEPRFLSATTPAKAALHVWSKGLSREVAPEGVTVNCIQPGRIRSEQLSRKYPTKEAEEAYAKTQIPIGRFGEPDDIAAVALFLSSDQASYITGAVIPVDGSFRAFAY